MKMVMIILVGNLPSVVAIIGAIILASKNLEGWGWLIFAAIMLHSSIKTS